MIKVYAKPGTQDWFSVDERIVTAEMIDGYVEMTMKPPYIPKDDTRVYEAEASGTWRVYERT